MGTAFITGPGNRWRIRCTIALMAEAMVKEELIELARSLPDDATWDDVEYLVYLKKEVGEGRRSAREEPTFTVNEIRAEYGLDALS